MADNFDKALGFTLGVEGGLSDSASDKGGRTNHGITQSTYNKWRLSKGLEKQDVFKINISEVKDIYHTWYWVPSHCDILPDKLAICMFDAMVNHSPTAAMIIMQAALGVTPDGSYGPNTRRAFINAKDTKDTIRAYVDKRIAYYCMLCKDDPTQLVFILGWVNRAFKLERFLNE